VVEINVETFYEMLPWQYQKEVGCKDPWDEGPAMLRILGK